MIKFIDLRGQGTDCSFAFFDTETDKFVEVSETQAWNRFTGFVHCCSLDYTDCDKLITRCRGLCPDWVCGNDK